MSDEPEVGDYIVLYDTEAEADEAPISLLRVTAAGYDAVGEGWSEQAGRLEEWARSLAHEGGTRAWRHRGGRYGLLIPLHAPKDVH